jgi:hypothetical protein
MNSKRILLNSNLPIAVACQGVEAPGPKTASYFKERAVQGSLSAFDTWLAASPDVPPMAGDEIEGN